MPKILNKYAKYITLLIVIFELLYFGIPDYVVGIFVYEYLLFFSTAYFLFILQDFFYVSKKMELMLRLVITVGALIILITSIYYKAILSAFFGAVMFGSFIFLLYLEIKTNKKNKQKT